MLQTPRTRDEILDTDKEIFIWSNAEEKRSGSPQVERFDSNRDELKLNRARKTGFAFHLDGGGDLSEWPHCPFQYSAVVVGAAWRFPFELLVWCLLILLMILNGREEIKARHVSSGAKSVWSGEYVSFLSATPLLPCHFWCCCSLVADLNQKRLSRVLQ